MKAFATQLEIQFRQDLRDKGVLMVYYLVPLVFYLVMGSIMKTLSMDNATPLILSITIFALSMSAFLGMPQSLVKSREDGILEAYRAAGIPPWSLPLSVIVISTAHIMLVSVIICFSAPYLFNAAVPESLGGHFFAVFLITLCSEGVGALLSCFVKKQNTMTLAAQCLFLPSIMFSGIMFPSELLPKPMQWLGEVLPATQGVRLLAGDELRITPLMILAAITVAAFAASVVMFRRISLRK
ncbi:MAG: ABC transporter permease [Oscillospiraceae bacterium]|jgi:ABC-2 type transport system permease protein|nr:ABC transporter permease [Oscillospiraceae bacterium]